MKNGVILAVLVLILVGGFWGWRVMKKPFTTPSPALPIASDSPNAQNSPSVEPNPTQSPNGLANPIADFKPRITKKFFGTYITPQNSPVQPERFSGYHTGDDVEYTDTTTDVPVFAINDGKIISAQSASGYGGVMVIQTQINDQTYYVIYGHIRLSSAKKARTEVKKGEQIAVLGTGFSSETDGERRHLHFGIAKSNTILGYVQSKAALSGWLDPLSLYP